MVFLHGREETAPAKRITVTVHETSSRTGILKALLVVPGEDLGLDGGDSRVRIQQVDGRVEPMRRHLDIAVEQDTIGMFDPVERPVVTFCKTIILVEAKNADAGKLLFEHLDRTVGRAIVGDDHVCPIGCVGHYRRKKTSHQFSAVPVEDDDRHPFFFSLVVSVFVLYHDVTVLIPCFLFDISSVCGSRANRRDHAGSFAPIGGHIPR